MKKNRLFHQKQFFDMWLSWIVRYPILVFSMACMLTLAGAAFTASYLSINTDTENMLSSELPFRKNSTTLSEAFPQFSDNIVIVVDAPTVDQTHDAANLLSKHLKTYPNLFGEIYDPGGSQFFRRNGLLYMGVDELEEYIEKLASAQPFLSGLNANPTLPQLFKLIDQIVENETNTENQTSIHLVSSTLTSIAEVMESQLTNSPRPLSWRSLISGENSSLGDLRRIIVIQPKTDFSTLQPGFEAFDTIHNLADQLKLKEKFEARVRLTGSLALAHEELQSVIDGLGLAGIISVMLVIGLLFWCLRSITLLISSLITLIFGLILTAGFATATVGSLNLISVTFSVLFIGLSVDFSIHFCLRYKETTRDSENHRQALVLAAKSCGPALALAAIAAAIGFYSFLPTDYIGLAELGLIAGSGMLIALLTNFTLLPVLILLLPKPKKPILTNPISHNFRVNSNSGFRALVLVLAVAVLITSIISFPKVGFDFDPMKLRDPKTESVSTLLEMMSEIQSTPYSMTILKDNLEEADKLSKVLSPLKVVDATRTLSSLIPENQIAKLEMIENLSLLLSPSLSTKTSAVKLPIPKIQESFVTLKNNISDTLKRPLNKDFASSAARLNSVMSRYEAKTKLSSSTINQLQVLLLGSFPQRVIELRKSLEAEEISYSKIPRPLRERWVSADGRARIELYPTGNMLSREALKTFVKDVQNIAPQATGAPVSIFEAGNTVVRAFVQAGVTTVLLIGILVLFLTRQIREFILIISPLFLAALITASTSAIFSLPFNFANVIVLPLLFGLGIAGNIHMVTRERQLTHMPGLMTTTTPQAVLFSALTTIGSFGSIALSSHPGTSSMGVLLTIAIISTLICTLIFLPTFMALWPTVIRHERVRGK